MSTHRIEALTDGVFAIVMTIMVLEFTPLLLKQFEPHLLEGLLARDIFPSLRCLFHKLCAAWHLLARSPGTISLYPSF